MPMISGWHPSRCLDAPKKRPEGLAPPRAGCGEEYVDSIQSQSPEQSSRGMTKLVTSAPWAVSHLRVSRPRRVCVCMGCARVAGRWRHVCT